MVPVLSFTLALLILTPVAMRLPRPSRVLGVPALLASALLMVVLLQGLTGIVWMLAIASFPGLVEGFAFDALPKISERAVQDLPSPLEAAVLTVCLYIVMMFAAGVWSYVRQRFASARRSAIHPSRLAQDADPMESAI